MFYGSIVFLYSDKATMKNENQLPEAIVDYI